jgi:hypothetical protein
MSNRKLPIIHEGLETGKNGKPVNNKGRRIKTNNTNQIVYNSEGKPVYNNNNNNNNNNILPKKTPKTNKTTNPTNNKSSISLFFKNLFAKKK